jgi:sugar phosphate isomerase/epimerase
MIKQLLLSVSFDELNEAIEVAAREGLGIEVTLYDTRWMMGESALADATEMGEKLAGHGMVVTAHGPLYDLNPGSLDPTIRSYSEDCFRRGVEVAAALGARRVVYHTCYNPLLPDGVLGGWKELAAPIWFSLLETAGELGMEVCLENSYEPTAEFFKDLFSHFSNGATRVCFDPAHVHLYSRDGQAAWIVTLGHQISHLHLNDNNGGSDDHLALGQGGIPYGTFLKDLCSACEEATVVLEMEVDRALQSIGFLRGIGIWDRT